MVGECRNGKDANFDPGSDQSIDDVGQAVDSMIDATLGVMTQTGGDLVEGDKGAVLLDLVNMFDDRVRVLEEGRVTVAEGEDSDALEDSIGRWRAARDRAAERYSGETGLNWERAGDQHGIEARG